VRLQMAGSLVELTDVPQDVCDSCGSRTYSPWVLERIEP
jgi:YgiT-type zinc finger domain-containing protein